MSEPLRRLLFLPFTEVSLEWEVVNTLFKKAHLISTFNQKLIQKFDTRKKRMHYTVLLGKSCKTACQSDHRRLAKEKKKQADTHHQQGKKDDPAAPDVCFPPIILLSLRTPKCLLAGRCSAWLKNWMEKLLARLESLKNAIPWWPLDRHSAEICWRNGRKFSVNKLNTREAAGERVRFKGVFFSSSYLCSCKVRVT